MTKVGIMQPYFLPYIGYWQLFNAVDEFVIYDNVQFTKSGWINRNRFLMNGKAVFFSLPLKKASDFLDVRDRELSASIDSEKLALLRRMENAYRRAPFFDEGMDLLDDVLSYQERNLFSFVLNSIKVVADYLSIKTNLVISSSLNVSESLKGKDRVVATCRELSAVEYINPIGGVELYDQKAFEPVGVKLRFQRVKPFQYRQFSHEFVPSLSIVDMVMFRGIDGARSVLDQMDIFDA